jgi:predicted homoserine dehydrogenase-like protein
MFLQNLISERNSSKKPSESCFDWCWKIGSMFLSQIPTTSGIQVVAIADLYPENAKKACKTVGWDDELISCTKFF